MTILGGKGLERALRGEPNPDTFNSRIFIQWNPEVGYKRYLKKGGLYEIRNILVAAGDVNWRQMPDGSVEFKETNTEGQEFIQILDPQANTIFEYQTELGNIRIRVFTQEQAIILSKMYV